MKMFIPETFTASWDGETFRFTETHPKMDPDVAKQLIANTLEMMTKPLSSVGVKVDAKAGPDGGIEITAEGKTTQGIAFGFLAGEMLVQLFAFDPRRALNVCGYAIQLAAQSTFVQPDAASAESIARADAEHASIEALREIIPLYENHAGCDLDVLSNAKAIVAAADLKRELQ